MAGIVGAKNDNSGVVGVAPGVDIYSLKVLNAQGVGELLLSMRSTTARLWPVLQFADGASRLSSTKDVNKPSCHTFAYLSNQPYLLCVSFSHGSCVHSRLCSTTVPVPCQQRTRHVVCLPCNAGSLLVRRLLV